MASDKPNAVAVIGAIFAVILIFVALMWFFGAKSAGAQDAPTVSIRDFSGGLVTNQNPLTLKPGQFVQLNNFDLSDEWGSLVLRKGDKAVTDSLARTIVSDITMTAAVKFKSIPSPGLTLLDIQFDANDLPAQQDGFWDGDTAHQYVGGVIVGSVADSIFEIAGYRQNLVDSTLATIWSFNAGDSINVGDSLALRIQVSEYSNQIDTGSVTGVYAYYPRNGQKFLLTVTPGFGAQNQWSSLMSSRANRYNQELLLSDNIRKDATPVWATLNDKVFMAIRGQRPIQYDGRVARPLIPRAPGQIEVLPAANGSLTGYYKWGIHQIPTGTGDDSTTVSFSRLSYVTPLIHLVSEDAKLTGFHRQAHDSLLTATNTKFHIMRTRGYSAGQRPVQDTFFVVATYDVAHGVIDTLTHIDNVSDASLNDSVTVVYPLDSATFVDNAHLNDTLADTIGLTGMRFSAPGAPKYMTKSYSGSGSPWVPPAKVDQKDPRDSTWIATGYFYTYFDTLTGAESDSSVNLTVNSKISDTTIAGVDSILRSIQVSLPAVNRTDSGMIRILYRYMWYKDFTLDSTYRVLDSYLVVDTSIFSDERGNRVIEGVDTSYLTRRHTNVAGQWANRRTAPYPVAILTNYTQTVYTDTLTWAQLWGRNELFIGGDPTNGRRQSKITVSPWRPHQPINAANYVYVYGDRLWLADGSRLFRSVLDTPGVFLPFNDVAFNLDDGDEITVITSSQRRMEIYKNYSKFVLYDPDNGLPTKGSQEFGIGCVAPQSMKEWGGRRFYLSADGVIMEQAAEFKDYTSSQGVISNPINNLILGRPMDSLKLAVGAIVEDKYLLSFPSTDTTFVYHIQQEAWSTYSFSFWQATRYDTVSTDGLVRSDKLVFARYGDERLFELYGSGIYYDSGLSSSVVGEFRTGPMFTDYNYWQIDKVGLMRGYTSGSNNKNVTLRVFDEFGNTVATQSILSDSTVFLRALPVHSGRYLSFDYLTTNIQPTLSDTIRSVDIWARPVSRSDVK